MSHRKRHHATVVTLASRCSSSSEHPPTLVWANVDSIVNTWDTALWLCSSQMRSIIWSTASTKLAGNLAARLDNSECDAPPAARFLNSSATTFK
jgi:hypothetical protein